MIFNVFIGYDQRENEAAHVCKYSIIKNASLLPNIHFLKSIDIPEYTRPREATQSTDFTYTRFMIPFLSNYEGFSIFCDCDFLFLDDINQLISNVDLSKPVSVVKHPQYIPNSQIKMDGVVQHTMPRKNWASLIVFNNSHALNKKLTPDFINTIPVGRDLHLLKWVDEEIGSIPLEWNVLDGYYELSNPKAVHFTDGGPWFENYQHTFYAPLWKRYYQEYKMLRG